MWNFSLKQKKNIKITRKYKKINNFYNKYFY